MSEQSRVNSRLVRKERNKLVKQTVVSGLVATITIVAFLFVILPAFVQLFTSFFDTTNPFQESDDIPPQVPVFAAPVEATNSARLRLDGYGEAESVVTIVLNGQKAAEQPVADDGTFSVELDLTDGENTLAGYATDEAKNESVVSKAFTTVLDTKNPELKLDEPAPNQEFVGRNQQDITVRGITEPKAKIYLNDRLIFPRSDGSFSTTYRLMSGENILKFRIVDQGGNTFEQEIKVKLSL